MAGIKTLTFSQICALPCLPSALPPTPPQAPPIQGIVPAVAGMINLINSKIPLLEYRGCHGLARLCYAAPYGCPNPKEHLKEAKSVAAVLGAIDALVRAGQVWKGVGGLGL